MMGLERIVPETPLCSEPCWQSGRKAVRPTVLSFYREMQSVGERKTHPQITDGEVKTEGMHGMQQPGIKPALLHPSPVPRHKIVATGLQLCDKTSLGDANHLSVC